MIKGKGLAKRVKLLHDQIMNKKDPLDSLNALNTPSNDHTSTPVTLAEDGITGDRFLLFSTSKGIEVQLKYEGDDLWMTQAQIAELFDVSRSSVTKHLGNIFSEGELEIGATSEESSQVRFEGDRKVERRITLYNLDAIIAIGYRVSSKQGTMFRQWATQKLVQFATKGFVVDAERLKTPKEHDYFKELQEIIRDIRASEANIYQELRNICALCSDYETLSEKDKNLFFATVQNKLHFAITGMTAAEIRIHRAQAFATNMGLTSWKGERPLLRDTKIAKNFFGEAEIRDLNRFTIMLLDYFEQQVDLQRLVSMDDAKHNLDKFIRNNERNLLSSAGSASKQQADAHCKEQFALYQNEMRAIANDRPDES